MNAVEPNKEQRMKSIAKKEEEQGHDHISPEPSGADIEQTRQQNNGNPHHPVSKRSLNKAMLLQAMQNAFKN